MAVVVKPIGDEYETGWKVNRVPCTYMVWAPAVGSRHGHDRWSATCIHFDGGSAEVVTVDGDSLEQVLELFTDRSVVEAFRKEVGVWA